MARIVVSISNAIFVNGEYRCACFYEQFLNSLKEAGNDVLVLVPSMFNCRVFCSNNELKSNIDEEYLQNAIKSFNAELVITFNNATYHRLLECVDCPVAIWDADMHPLWNQVEYIKKNVDRYTFLCFSNFGIACKSDFFKIKKNKLFHVANATSLKSQKLEKDINISFIGTFFGSRNDISNFIKEHSGEKTLLRMMRMLKEDPFLSRKNILAAVNLAKNSNIVSDFEKIEEGHYCAFFSNENRINALNAICDLGLDLYGDDGWLSICDTLPSLSAHFNKEKVLTALSNQNIYNRSKICLNINHPQSVHGMPWRVCDIMATSGCLVSSYSSVVQDYFKKYVKIPVFHNQFEARDLCTKLLNDNVWRQEIVTGSNLAIKAEHLWIYRIREMEKIFNIKLENKNAKGTLRIFRPRYKSSALNGLFENFGLSVSVQNIPKTPRLKNKKDFHFSMKIWPNKKLVVTKKKKTHE